MENKYIAPYLIRSYVWELLKRNAGMDNSQYNVDGTGPGLVPIVPLGEEPEIKEFGLPYLVYGYSESPSTNERISGNMAFAIYATNFGKLSEVTNIVAKAFQSDGAAQNVNRYTSTIPAFVGIRFGFIENTSVDGGAPEDEEGGNMSALVTLRYEYYADYNLEVEFAEWDEEDGYTILQS